MEVVDPATGAALPADAIQRVLFLTNTTHVYNIPPLPSTRGHMAAAWTEDPSRHIFTARLRLLETSSADADLLKVDLVLEDASSGALFAAAPYANQSSVEPVIDSSRFFAITVRDPSGRKAVLGIGFEERSDAFDFAVALQAARRALGWEGPAATVAGAPSRADEPRDYSLKDGEKITVNIGAKGLGRRRPRNDDETPASSENLQSFALAPPPPPPAATTTPDTGGDGGAFSLPPPPSATDARRKRRSVQQLGFDDGQFGEFA
ncbi:adaptin ear-binding coat-associated protein 1/2 [Geosmithia morbida]|uniref:Adaptin ear-binding coat-associated protein 1/2 n=1 Tax=Geosmithia morbida TaxID=1094350 RepID=A0A9P5D1P9_9HYPO|nr:adaptin ear-binding coat-associated protein 1/2 [Geosmithia morbida]KAF4122987.1 adaptin ear-binding coat-associated protein 1/2 [Geosmithia morbida]